MDLGALIGQAITEGGVVENVLGIPLGTLGAGAGWPLVALFVILMYRGNLVPRKTLEDERHEKNEWRTESRIKDQQIAELSEMKRLLVEYGTTTRDIMRSIQVMARSDRRRGDLADDQEVGE